LSVKDFEAVSDGKCESGVASIGGDSGEEVIITVDYGRCIYLVV
jgi:hypothetical protein